MHRNRAWVDNVEFMCGLNRVGDLPGDLKDPGNSDLTLGDHCCQVGPIDELHHDIGVVAFPSNIVDLDAQARDRCSSNDGCDIHGSRATPAFAVLEDGLAKRRRRDCFALSLGFCGNLSFEESQSL